MDLNLGQTGIGGEPAVGSSVPRLPTKAIPSPDMEAVVPITVGVWLTVTRVLRALNARVTELEQRLNAAEQEPISEPQTYE